MRCKAVRDDEDYQGSDGLKGVSLSIYDASRRVWQQSWVTNHDRLLVIDGNLRADKMILAGTYTTASGEETLVRGNLEACGRGC